MSIPRPALEAFIEGRETEELRATIRLAHQTIGRRHRMGWLEAPWWPRTRGWLSPGGTSPEPLILAALCVALGEELVRRGASFLVCAPCRSALELDTVPIVTGGRDIEPTVSVGQRGESR